MFCHTTCRESFVKRTIKKVEDTLVTLGNLTPNPDATGLIATGGGGGGGGDGGGGGVGVVGGGGGGGCVVVVPAVVAAAVVVALQR